ncbi:MAG: GntR family transcriptional regulator [Evtepia sp.]|nr:GntR family transcriptional regulator [Evtepia sp.]
MLTYNLEHIPEKSMYEHLYRCIKDDIVLGKLKANEKLPSKRSFAKNLGISNTTVENAYAQLVTEGYLYSLPKKGYFVSSLDKQVVEKPAPSEALQEKSSQRKEYFADFMSGAVATDAFPFSVWIKLLRNVMATEDKATLLTDRPAGGLVQLRNAIANHLLEFRGMNVLPEQIIVGAGTEYLYTVLVQLLGRERIYGVEDPGYMRLTWIYERNDIFCRHIPMDHAGVMLKALEESGTEILHITPSHHFPTGIVMPASRRYELLGWASAQEGRYIIEDDYDCEFRLSGKPIPTLQSIDQTEKVIYINTFSQSLAPAFRMSYLVLPLHLVKRFYEILGFYSGTVSCFEQLTLARFLEGGYFEKHINRMRTYYRNLRDQLLQEIKNSPLQPIVRISEENSGVHFLMEVETEKTDGELIEAADKAGILLSCVSQYYYEQSKQKQHVLVLNYSGIPPEKVKEVVARLARCITKPDGME